MKATGEPLRRWKMYTYFEEEVGNKTYVQGVHRIRERMLERACQRCLVLRGVMMQKNGCCLSIYQVYLQLCSLFGEDKDKRPKNKKDASAGSETVDRQRSPLSGRG